MCVSQLGLSNRSLDEQAIQEFERAAHLWAGEERQGAVGVRGRPEDLLEGGVWLLPAGPATVGGPLTPGSCTPGSQRRGTGLLQSAIVVFGNVIVIAFVFLADGKRTVLYLVNLLLD